MTTYNLDKVRVACLEVLGYQLDQDHRRGSSRQWWKPDTKYRAFFDSEVPDPPGSMDDALVLMEIHGIAVRCCFGRAGKWCAWVGVSPLDVVEVFDDSPALAVCLAALRRVGRDLVEFTHTGVT